MERQCWCRGCLFVVNDTSCPIGISINRRVRRSSEDISSKNHARLYRQQLLQGALSCCLPGQQITSGIAGVATKPGLLGDRGPRQRVAYKGEFF